MRRTLKGMALAMAGMMAVGACGGSSGGSTSNATTGNPGASTARAAIAPNLRAQLLSLSDFPAGWSIDNTKNNSGSAPACFKELKDNNTGKSHASASFKDGTSVPGFQEGLGYYPGTAQQRMAQLQKALSGCGQIKFSSGGHDYSGTVGQLSYPMVGDQTVAYQLALSSKVSSLNITVGFDLIAARKGSTVIGMIYEDLGTPPITQVEQLVTKATAKVTAS